ncbi:MAG: thiol-disulfide oxidoreductase DCC family protein [Pyrinomonadaceae bacterium]
MSAVILFDGVCNFCNGAVNFIIARDSKGYFKFAPLQSEIGERLLAENGIDKINTDSVVLIEDGKVYTYSTAALRVARQFDGLWSWLYAFIVVPKPVRDFFYRLFAKYRYKLFGKKDECMLPTPDVRARFLAMS